MMVRYNRNSTRCTNLYYSVLSRFMCTIFYLKKGSSVYLQQKYIVPLILIIFFLLLTILIYLLDSLFGIDIHVNY